MSKVMGFFERRYAQLLSMEPRIKWEFESKSVSYVEGGRARIYKVPFVIEFSDGSVHWVEARPDDEVGILPKYTAASESARYEGATFRGLTKKEYKDIMTCGGE